MRVDAQNNERYLQATIIRRGVRVCWCWTRAANAIGKWTNNEENVTTTNIHTNRSTFNDISMWISCSQTSFPYHLHRHIGKHIQRTWIELHKHYTQLNKSPNKGFEMRMPITFSLFLMKYTARAHTHTHNMHTSFHNSTIAKHFKRKQSHTHAFAITTTMRATAYTRKKKNSNNHLLGFHSVERKKMCIATSPRERMAKLTPNNQNDRSRWQHFVRATFNKRSNRR